LAGNSAAEILNLLQLADVAYQQGEYAEARLLASEGLTKSTDHSHRWGIARALYVRGQITATEKDYDEARVLHEQSLAIQQELGDQQGQARTLAALAWVALCQGETDQARLHYETSLRVARDSEERLEIARGLEGLADLDSRIDPDRALRLAGAAGALRKTMGAEPYPEERRRLEGWLNVVYAARGEKVCAEARAAGRAIPLPQVIAYALERSAALR
jgi:tetratricopeptide (TPR) repeat protein